MIIKAAKIIPNNEDGGGVPIRPLHYCIDRANCPVLALAGAFWRMLAHFLRRQEPTDRRKVSANHVDFELLRRGRPFLEKRAFVNVTDGREDPSTYCIVFPGDGCPFEEIRQSLKIETRRLAGQVAALIQNRNGAGRITIAISSQVGTVNIVSDASSLGSNREKMIRKTGAMHSAEISVRQTKRCA